VREAVTGYRRVGLADELVRARAALAAAAIEGSVGAWDEGAVALGEPAEETIGWVLREAVANVVRHSHARHCVINVRRDGGGVVLEVCDDGVGGASPVHLGNGLAGMRERLAIAEGSLDFGPAGQGGFVVRARVPAGASCP
jgi:two-component system sensor histidine kinase DesK